MTALPNANVSFGVLRDFSERSTAVALQALLHRARLYVDELGDVLRAAFAPDYRWVWQDPGYAVMEERIVLSASPLSAAVAEISDTLTAPDAQSIQQQLYEPVTAQASTADDSVLIVLDSSVDDFESLHRDLLSREPEASVVLLSEAQSGLEQIEAALHEKQSVSAVHILSHAADGHLKLGNQWLTAADQAIYARSLSAWSHFLQPDADVLLYGCNLAASENGQSLLDHISRWTGADVAASTNLTGSSTYGADWQLEYQLGRVQATGLFAQHASLNWSGLLGTLAVTNTSDISNGDTSSIAALLANDGGDGISLREAIEAANRTPNLEGPDRIEFALADSTIPHVIRMTSNEGLPAISDPLELVGLIKANTFGKEPTIVLDGDGRADFGLEFRAGSSGSLVQGLSFVNFRNGILVTDSGNTQILDNYIGLLPNASPDLNSGNAVNGILLQRTSGNLIDGNVIVDSRNAGITLTSDAAHNVVTNNLIGVDPLGNARGNVRRGIGINGSRSVGNEIGRPGEGNVIAHSKLGDGVFLWSSTSGNSIRGNSIYENAGLGIDLLGGYQNRFGVTPNDTIDGQIDADDGPNNLQNFPTITQAFSNTLSTAIEFHYLAGEAHDVIIDFYASDAADASGHGEGQRYLGSYRAGPTQGAEVMVFELPQPIDDDVWITATATSTSAKGSFADTSEFSLAVPVQRLTQPIVDLDLDNSSGLFGGDYATQYVVGDPAVSIADDDTGIAGLEVGRTLQSISVTIDDAWDGGSERLTWSVNATSDLTYTYDEASHQLTITGKGTLDEYETALRQVRYENLSAQMTGDHRVVHVRVHDGVALGMASRAHIQFDSTVVEPNLAPVHTDARLPEFDEDRQDLPHASVSELFGGGFRDDNSAHTLAGVAVTSNTASTAQGTWQYSTNLGLTWQPIGAVSETAAMVLRESSLLRFVPAVQYFGSPNPILTRAIDSSYQGSFSSGLSRSVWDASEHGGSTALSATTGALDVNVLPVNDAPTWSETSPSLTYAEGAPNLLLPTIEIQDVDSTDFHRGQLRAILTSDDPQAVLRWSIGGSVTTNNQQVLVDGLTIGTWQFADHELVVDFHDQATIGRVQKLVQSMEYAYVGDTPDVDHEIQVVLNDGDGGTSDPARILVSFPTSDAQLLLINEGISVLEGGLAVIDSNVLSAEFGRSNSAPVFHITRSPEYGRLTLPSQAAVTRFKLSDLQSGRLSYQHAGSEHPTDSFEFEVFLGTRRVADAEFSIIVQPVNDAPFIVHDPNAFATDEDTTVTFDVLRNDVDPDGDPVTITHVDGHVVFLGDTVMITGGEVTLNADMSLTLAPKADFSGDITFHYAASDKPFFATSQTAQVSGKVRPVNDPPQLRVEPLVTEIPEDFDSDRAVIVASFVIVDDDLGSTQFSLAGPDANLFELTETHVVMRPGAFLDFETNPVLNVELRVDDPTVGRSVDDLTLLTIDVTNANDAPTVELINLVSTFFELRSEIASEVRVADIVIIDDALGTAEVSLLGPHAEWFRIDGDSLWLRASGLDASIPSFEVTVEVSDPSLASSSMRDAKTLVVTDTIAPLNVNTEQGSGDDDTAEDSEDSTSEPDAIATPSIRTQATKSATTSPMRVAHLGNDRTGRDFSNFQTRAKMQETLLGAGSLQLPALLHGSDRADHSLVARYTRFVEQLSSRSDSLPRLRLADTSLSLSPFHGLPIPAASADEIREFLMLGTTTLVSSTLSVGYALWALRSGTIVASVASTLPSWVAMDPLPILDRFEERFPGDDEEALISMMEKLDLEAATPKRFPSKTSPPNAKR